MRLAAIGALALLLLAGMPAAAQEQSCADPVSAPVARPDLQGRPLLFDRFVQPLVDESARRRAQWTSEDPEFVDRVDAPLNAHRLNIALLGFGEEHEQTYGDTGISVTILSLVIGVLGSYALGRFKFPGRLPIMYLILSMTHGGSFGW